MTGFRITRMDIVICIKYIVETFVGSNELIYKQTSLPGTDGSFELSVSSVLQIWDPNERQIRLYSRFYVKGHIYWEYN